MDADDPGRCTERELTEPVDECNPAGRLNRAAVGWSRTPLHRCNLSGSPLRKKRWDYWCVTTDTHLVSITYTDLDYAGLANVWLLDFASDVRWEKQAIVPFAWGFSQPDTVAGGDIHFAGQGLEIDVLEEPDATLLHVAFRDRGEDIAADLRVAKPPGHESLSVVIPWSDRRFQYTSKHNTRPATGSARAGGRSFAFGPGNGAFGCLDYGRGVWPRRSAWNWASASGVQRGRVVGLNLGGQWTDGTGGTENGLCLDGRLHKLSEDLVWTYDRAEWMAPWTIRTPRSKRVDLAFTPFHHKGSELDLRLVGTKLHVLFGRFEGTVISDAGETIAVSHLVGWAEEHLAKW